MAIYYNCYSFTLRDQFVLGVEGCVILSLCLAKWYSCYRKHVCPFFKVQNKEAFLRLKLIYIKELIKLYNFQIYFNTQRKELGN